ncbi:MAG: hypothetical protein FWC27_08290 [Firmicutes bacterium]|nr:hypothetical protein [Bacillota bacterium]
MKTKRFFSILLALCLAAGMAFTAGVSANALAVVPAGYVTISVDANVLGTGAGVLYGPALVPFYAGESLMNITDRFLADNCDGSVTAYGFFLNGVKLPRNITVAVPSVISDAVPDFTAAGGHTQAGEFLASGDFAGWAGWMYTLGNETLYDGADAVAAADGAVLRWQYSLAVGNDLGFEDWMGSPGLIPLTDRDALAVAAAQVNSAPNKAQLLADAPTLAAYNTAMGILSDLLAAQTDIDTAAAALNAAALAAARTLRLAAITAVATGLVEADYTAASWAALQTAITAAKTAVNSAGTVTAVNAVAVPSASQLVTKLTEAKNAKLAALSAVTNGLSEADYTAESWDALQAEITAAKKAVNDAATVAAVNLVTVPTAAGLELTCLAKWQAKLPDWLSGVIKLPNWVQWIVMIVGFGWIWWLFR